MGDRECNLPPQLHPLQSAIPMCYADFTMTAERNRPEQFTLEQVAQSAKEVILRDGKHLPTLIALGSLHNVVTRFSQMPDTHKGRAVMMHRTGSVIAEAGEVGDLQKVYFVVEAWMNTAREDGTFDLPPSKDPNRIEVLIVDSMDVQENEGDLIILEMVREDRKSTRLNSSHQLI